MADHRITGLKVSSLLDEVVEFTEEGEALLIRDPGTSFLCDLDITVRTPRLRFALVSFLPGVFQRGRPFLA